MISKFSLHCLKLPWTKVQRQLVLLGFLHVVLLLATIYLTIYGVSHYTHWTSAEISLVKEITLLKQRKHAITLLMREKKLAHAVQKAKIPFKRAVLEQWLTEFCKGKHCFITLDEVGFSDPIEVLKEEYNTQTCHITWKGVFERDFWHLLQTLRFEAPFSIYITHSVIKRLQTLNNDVLMEIRRSGSPPLFEGHLEVHVVTPNLDHSGYRDAEGGAGRR